MFHPVDMHCDTISRLWRNRQEGNPGLLRRSSLSVDLEKMQQGGYLLQNFAMFVFMSQDKDPLVNVLELIDEYYYQLGENADLLAPVFSYEDIAINQKNGKLSALLTIEEGGVLKGNIQVLRNLWRLGVRMLTLTWNFENEIGWPNTVVKMNGYDSEKHYGLKPAGIEIVREMNRLGMIVDVSHLGDDGFWDVVKYSDAPFVASHSNARSICDHTRNMTDDMIRALADHGGVMGINFCNSFLNTKGPGTIDDMIRHIKHIKNIGGIGCIGLGTDFDGIDNVPEVKDASAMQLLAQGMEKAGFTISEIEAVFSENVLRVYKEVLS